MNALRNLRQRDIALIVIVIVIVAAVIWYFYMYQPTQERIAQLETSITQLDTQIRQAQAAQRNLPELERAVQELEADREAFLAQLPTENEVAALLDTLRDAADEAGVTFETISSGGSPSQDVQGVRSLGYAVNTRGTYAETFGFLAQLEAFTRFTKIQQVGLTVDDATLSDPPLNANYNFIVYVFTGGDPGAGATP